MKGYLTSLRFTRLDRVINYEYGKTRSNPGLSFDLGLQLLVIRESLLFRSKIANYIYFVVPAALTLFVRFLHSEKLGVDC
jgi:hypothetical protein